MDRIIFYSWQSDSPGATNRSFIEKALKNVARVISGDKAIQFEASVDRDTAGLAGSPDISNAIFTKINKADIFVADVSIVNPVQEGRKTPNPNVLIELGYAINALGFDRIILVFNTAYGKIEELPFDLRAKRIMSYHASAGEPDRSTSRITLEKQLDQAIRLAFLQQDAHSEEIQSQAFTAIEQVSPKRHIILRSELNHIFAELVRLEPAKKINGGNQDSLYTSLEATIPHYLQFARLTELAVLLNDDPVLKEIYQWFGKLFERNNRLSDHAGGTYDEDFDYFRFLSHELVVTFVSFLLAGQQLKLLVTFLKTPIMVNYLREENGPGEVYYRFGAQFTHTLHAQNENSKTYSAHGLLLKQRHNREDIAEVVPFRDFMVADYFLFLYDCLIYHPNPGDWYKWKAWTAPYLNETPMFLKRIERVDAANEFVKLMNLESIEQLRQLVEEITLNLTGDRRIELFLRSFDFQKIGTKA